MSITKISPSVVDFDDGITITVDDNSDTLTLTSTDADAASGPILNFYRNSSSAADADLLGKIDFTGKNDAGSPEDVTYIRMFGKVIDASDGTEDGQLHINTMVGGSITQRVTISPTELIINDASADLDFRVESDANTNALFVDGGQNAIGIQTATEHDGTALVYPLTINAGNHSGNALEVHRTTNSRGYWYASDTGTHYLDVYGSSSPNLRFRVAGSDVAKVTSAGICFGSDTAAANALDDYEEGTWTPAYGATTASASITGRYVKIGSLVHITMYSGAQTLSSSTGAAAQVTGLPFTAESYYTPLSIAHYNSFAHDHPQPYVQTATKIVYFIESDTTTYTSWVDGSGKYLMLAGTYTTAE